MLGSLIIKTEFIGRISQTSIYDLRWRRILYLMLAVSFLYILYYMHHSLSYNTHTYKRRLNYLNLDDSELRRKVSMILNPLTRQRKNTLLLLDTRKFKHIKHRKYMGIQDRLPLKGTWRLVEFKSHITE